MVERSWQEGVESAIDALCEQVVKLREDMTKTNQAGLLENQMVSRINDLVGLQATQIRDLVRQCGDLDKALSRHLDEMGYSE